MAAIGFFGKLPSAGDFVQRRLPPGFVDAWDSHFEGAVAESRQALGSGWHDAYRASPAWRFVLARGVCGDAAWAGVMGPGTDRVGRCFPMVVAAPVAIDTESAARALLGRDAWFDAVERAYAMGQADAGIGVEAFDAQVAALAAPLDAVPLPAPAGPGDIDWRASAHWRLPLSARADSSSLGELWARLAAVAGRWCLWWTAGAERVPASVLATDGLPQPGAYAGFLGEGMDRAPWRSPGVVAAEAPRRFEPLAGSDLTLPAAPPPSAQAMPPAWLPDDPELFSGLAAASPSPSETARAVAEPTPQGEPAAVSVLHRPDAGATLVAASAAMPDPRQRAVAAVIDIGRGLPAAEWTNGLHALRTQVMALNPPLRHASEDLVDPVSEDCAVLAVRVAAGRADLLRIGAAAAWHWRQGNLRPVFAAAVEPPAAGALGDDFDDLLFSRGRQRLPGLGAAPQPACDETACAVQAGDRLLLLATDPLLQLAPDVLVRSLAMPSRDDACLHLATAAGLDVAAGHWPIVIIEVDA